MASVVPPDPRDPVDSGRATSSWRNGKRYLWLLGSIVPCSVFASWLVVHATGLDVFWWLAPAFSFGVLPLLDYIVKVRLDNPAATAIQALEGDPFYRWVIALYLPAQYLSLIFACWLWSGGGWLAMTAADKVGLMVTVGIIGGVAINAAHELGHKQARAERRLSKLALAQTGYGHFFVEHNRGHHLRVATAEDPASARFGESVYCFIPRSVGGGVRSAWYLESRRWARQGKSRWNLQNDILNAWLITLVLYIVLAVWFGPVVLPWLIGQAVIGFCLLEVVNYLEHYGLRRQKLPDGRHERVSASHSWNSSTLVANIFLFHLQRHSDHHINPGRRYQALRGTDESPQLPGGYGAMVLLALLPPLWRRIMNPRVLAHYGGDITLVALSPRDEERMRADGRIGA